MFIFENLESYKHALEFTKRIFVLKRGIKDRVIVDQLSRAALSITLNIAEGQGRIHQKEKRQFYQTARGSLYECLPLIQICFELQYFTKEEFISLYELMNLIGKLLAGLIRSLEN